LIDIQFEILTLVRSVEKKDFDFIEVLKKEK